MPLSADYLEDGRHLARLHRRRCAYAPTSNTASHDQHEKINSWVSFSFLFEYGAPPELRYYLPFRVLPIIGVEESFASFQFSQGLGL